MASDLRGMRHAVSATRFRRTVWNRRCRCDRISGLHVAKNSGCDLAVPASVAGSGVASATAGLFSIPKDGIAGQAGNGTWILSHRVLELALVPGHSQGHHLTQGHEPIPLRGTLMPASVAGSCRRWSWHRQTTLRSYRCRTTGYRFPSSLFPYFVSE